MTLFDVYSVFDIEIEKALGAYVWDKNGQKYLDLYGGHAVISIGHTHPVYVNAIKYQLDKVGFYSNSVLIPGQQQLAKKLGEISGYDDYLLFLCNSGAEANENALKLASFKTGRKKIIAFSSAFHGRTSLAVSVTDNKKYIAPANENEHIIFLPFNDEAALEEAMSDDICAVIVEGIQGVGGVQIPTSTFLKKIETLCAQYGSIFIADEVQSGYGRTGKFFAHQQAGVKPDIISIAKGMGNGFPIGGILISPKFPAIKESLGTTFGGNHLACAAGNAVLEVMENESLMENAERLGHYLVQALNDIPQIKDLRSVGLMTGIELHEAAAPVRKKLLEEHHIFTGSSSQKNTIRLLPPLCISEVEIDEFVTAFKHCL